MYFVRNSPTANANEDFYDSLQYATPVFDSLLVWQSGNTNAFYQAISAKDYPSGLRDMIEILVRNNRETEVAEFLNKELDLWIITEACHSRPSEKWPDRENKKEWDFLTRIYENRLLHPHSARDGEGDAFIKEILEKTQQTVNCGEN